MKINLHEMALAIHNAIAMAPERCQTRSDLNRLLRTSSDWKRNHALSEVIDSMTTHNHLHRHRDEESTTVVFWLPDRSPGGMVNDTVPKMKEIRDYFRLEDEVEQKQQEPAVAPNVSTSPVIAVTTTVKEADAETVKRLDEELKKLDARREAFKPIKAAIQADNQLSINDRRRDAAEKYINSFDEPVTKQDIFDNVEGWSGVTQQVGSRLLNTLMRHKKIKFIPHKDGNVRYARKGYVGPTAYERVVDEVEAVAEEEVEEVVREIPHDGKSDPALDTAIDQIEERGRTYHMTSVPDTSPRAYLDSTGMIALESHGQITQFDLDETKAILSLLSHIASLSRLAVAA